LPDRSTRFLIDTNLFVAAIKSGKTRSTELLVRLIEGPWDLVGDDILIMEYERYSRELEKYLAPLTIRPFQILLRTAPSAAP
jgi:hypothetical protein